MQDQFHNQLESDVAEFLRQNDFLTPDAVTYHEAWGQDVQDILKMRYSRTALYARTRADRFAIHKTADCEFEFEPKTTPPTSNYDNLVFEALPFCFHLFKARLGVRCLYPIRIKSTDFEKSFWVGPEVVSLIEWVRVPNRWTKETCAEYLRDFREMLPGVKVEPCATTKGSSDPFCMIKRRNLEALPHWKEAILQELNAGVTT